MVGDWILLADIRPPSKVLYWALSGHLNAARGDSIVYPTQDDLAAMLGYSEGRKIRQYLDELVAIGAVEVARSPRNARRHVYTVHESPPPGYAGMESLREFYAARHAEYLAMVAAAHAAEAEADTAEAV